MSAATLPFLPLVDPASHSWIQSASEDSSLSQLYRSTKTKVRCSPEFPDSDGIRDPAAGYLKMWNSLCKATGSVGNCNKCESIFNFQIFWFLFTLCVCVCVFVTQLCPTLCNPLNCSPPGSSVPGILQARILESITITKPPKHLLGCQFPSFNVSWYFLPKLLLYRASNLRLCEPLSLQLPDVQVDCDAPLTSPAPQLYLPSSLGHGVPEVHSHMIHESQHLRTPLYLTHKWAHSAGLSYEACLRHFHAEQPSVILLCWFWLLSLWPEYCLVSETRHQSSIENFSRSWPRTLWLVNVLPPVWALEAAASLSVQAVRVMVKGMSLLQPCVGKI